MSGQVTALEEQLSSATGEKDAAKTSLGETARKLDEVSREKREVELEFKSYKEHHNSSNNEQVQAIAELKVSVDRLSTELDTKQTEVVQQKEYIETNSEYATRHLHRHHHHHHRRRHHHRRHHRHHDRHRHFHCLFCFHPHHLHLRRFPALRYVTQLEQKLRHAEKCRRDLHNNIQELKGSIRVFCRVRPAPDDAVQAVEIGAPALCRCSRPPPQPPPPPPRARDLLAHGSPTSSSSPLICLSPHRPPRRPRHLAQADAHAQGRQDGREQDGGVPLPL